MESLFNLLSSVFSEIGRIRAAAALAREGRHDLAKKLISG